MVQGVTISGLFIYPVKSLAGVSLQTSELDSMGLKYDRRWMLVSADGLFLSQRKVPKMALIHTVLVSMILAKQCRCEFGENVIHQE